MVQEFNFCVFAIHIIDNILIFVYYDIGNIKEFLRTCNMEYLRIKFVENKPNTKMNATYFASFFNNSKLVSNSYQIYKLYL